MRHILQSLVSCERKVSCVCFTCACLLIAEARGWGAGPDSLCWLLPCLLVRAERQKLVVIVEPGGGGRTWTGVSRSVVCDHLRSSIGGTGSAGSALPNAMKRCGPEVRRGESVDLGPCRIKVACALRGGGTPALRRQGRFPRRLGARRESTLIHATCLLLGEEGGYKSQVGR